MFAWTPEERRGAALVVALLLLGAAWDGWRAWRPAFLPAPAPAMRAERTAPGDPPRAAEQVARAPARGDTLDLNRASESDLDRLPGIGPVLARRIVEHRERHGPFRRIEELRAVRGVGPRLLERLRERVTVLP